MLIGTNLFWAYSALDSGITQSYQQLEMDFQSQVINSLGDIIIKGAQEYTQKDILHLLRQHKPNELIVEEGNTIIFDGIKFEFENNRLKKITKY